ncbi:MAG TPA: PEP-CTERM sorting domain-containing protein [Chthonomonadaceae bacterium]|nr:PEP-CTERM sorting domain-containing protein [Chthonomonadaceae bacterium]
MKLKLTLATMALALFGPVAAYAGINDVTISLAPVTDNTVFSATFTNTLATPVTISANSISPAADSDDLADSLFNNGPLTLAANAVSSPFNFDYTTPIGSINDITYAVKDPNNVIIGCTGPGCANIVVIPEPGSIAALLVGTTMGGGLLLARRRRK